MEAILRDWALHIVLALLSLAGGWLGWCIRQLVAEVKAWREFRINMTQAVTRIEDTGRCRYPGPHLQLYAAPNGQPDPAA
jgi:hypothetical protein